jgi:predicted transcriptional regulator
MPLSSLTPDSPAVPIPAVGPVRAGGVESKHVPSRGPWVRDNPALRHARFSRTLKGMEVHFTPEQETQLSQIATRTGTDAERLVKDAALRLLEEEARFRAAVREGIAQADRGEFIEEEEMDARLEQMLRS